jgi:aconitate hydratase
MGVLPLDVQGRPDRAVARSLRQGELRDHRPERRRGEDGDRGRTPASGAPIKFEVRVRIDTPKEREYFQHGGILHYVLRQLASSSKAA